MFGQRVSAKMVYYFLDVCRYYLTLVREEQAEAASSLEGEIENFVAKRVPGSVLMESVGQEMVFQMPSSGKFEFLAPGTSLL